MLYLSQGILALVMLNVLDFRQIQAVDNPSRFTGYRQSLLGAPPPGYGQYWDPYIYGRQRIPHRESIHYPRRSGIYNMNVPTMNLLRTAKGASASADTTGSSSKIVTSVAANSYILPTIKSGSTSSQLYRDSVTRPIANINRLKTQSNSINREKYLSKFQLPPDVNTENVLFGIHVLSKMSLMLGKKAGNIDGKSTDSSQVISKVFTKKNPSRELWKMLERIGSLKGQFKSPSIDKYNGVVQPTKPITISTILSTSPSKAKKNPPAKILSLPPPAKIVTSLSVKPQPASDSAVNDYWSRYGINTNILSLASNEHSTRGRRTYSG
ncbi:hypothetical protein K7432_012044 [Basidiobolus ranarum]|uniref:Uncharacterized protein n=1 Tax=Basidiobolus ranarum TaxID=34480 RepID=A0ABR2VSX0_9FUNG